jgi:anti-sigma factor RsiW
MRCSKARKGLGALLDGEFDPTAAGELRGHIESCPSCRSTLEELERVESFLGDALAPPHVPGFAARVAAEASSRLSRPVHTRAKPVAWAWPGRAAPARCAVAVGAAAGLLIGALMAFGIRSDTSVAGDPRDSYAVETYGMDYLTDAPRGSVAETYLSALALPAGEEVPR